VRNAVHGSDSIETATKEIAFFFPLFDSNLNKKDRETET